MIKLAVNIDTELIQGILILAHTKIRYTESIINTKLIQGVLILVFTLK